MRRTLGDHHPEFGQMAPQGVDDLRALSHEKITRPKADGRRLPLFALDRTNRIVGRCAASQIASASAASFFWRFTNGFTYAGGINRTSWPMRDSSRPQ